MFLENAIRLAATSKREQVYNVSVSKPVYLYLCSAVFVSLLGQMAD